MTGGQIRYVHVVALAGAIRRGIVLSEHLELGAPARRLDRARDQVDLRVVVLTHLPVRVCTGRVEVAQCDGP